MPDNKDIIIHSRDRAVPIEEYARLPKVPVTVVLDNLRSSFNVGAIFRTAECARIERLITCGITAHPPHDKVLKTSLGTTEFVPHLHLPTVSDALIMAREAGARIVALETTSRSRTLFAPLEKKPTFLFLGNEALGLSREVVEQADEVVEIPLLGYKNSLNVSVALGIALFEILRQWGELDRK